MIASIPNTAASAIINKITMEIVAATNRIASFSCCLRASIAGYPKTRIPVIDADVIKNIMNPLTSTKFTEDISSSGNKRLAAGIRKINTAAANKTYNSVPVAWANPKSAIFRLLRFVFLLKKLMPNSPLVNDCL
jgi:hypothetical protein